MTTTKTRPAREPMATVQEVSEYLGVTPNALYIMRCRSTGPRSSKVGREIRYRWADVERWIDQRSKSPAS